LVLAAEFPIGNFLGHLTRALAKSSRPVTFCLFISELRKRSRSVTFRWTFPV